MELEICFKVDFDVGRKKSFSYPRGSEFLELAAEGTVVAESTRRLKKKKMDELIANRFING